MAWYPDPGLAQLSKQVRKRFPGIVTGFIGDENHKPPSDHLPEEDGSVDASDLMIGPHFTHADAQRTVDDIVRSRDRRVAYIIWNRRIISSTVQPWVWRPYSGGDPHTGHVHISVNDKYESDDSPWKVFTMTPAEFLAALLAALKTPAFRKEFAEVLKTEPVNFQLRRAPWAYVGAPLPADKSMITYQLDRDRDAGEALTDLLERPAELALSAEDRALIVAELVTATTAAIGEAVATAIGNVELAPRPNTP